ncbi:Tetratricopeptide repeat-containing protein [Marivirga sericea]|uniref:histidine kinase n=2 Tax=Marivirga sericea TaxID=1028 RepID=A0A1X7JZT9_9BACT|nr:Tetratricopeptide repeat-containing protein [Marivirga sericea]
MRFFLFHLVLIFSQSGVSYSQETENAYFDQAKELRNKNQLDSSFHYFVKAKNLFLKSQDSIGLALTNNYLGLISLSKNDKSNALNYLYTAIKINKSINNKDGLVGNYNNLANYYIKEDLKLALSYYQEAQKLLPKERKDTRSAIINMNIGVIFSSKDGEYFNYDSAIHYYLNSLESFKAINDSSSMSFLYHNLGFLYESKDNLEAAMNSYERSIELRQELKDDQEGLAKSFMAKGNILLKQKKYKESLEQYEKSLQIATTLGDEYRKMNLYSNMVKAKMGIGAVEEASVLFQEYNHLRDSLSTSEKMQEVKDLETKYETEKKEAEIKEQQLAIAEKNFQKNLFLGLSIALVVLIISTIWFFLQKQDYLKKLKNEEISNMKTEQELKELNAMMHGQEEERNRIASDLHDRLGARLSSIKLLFQSEQNETASNLKGKLLDNINEAIKETREISHNLSTDMLTRFGLETALKDMVRTINEAEKIKAELAIYGLQARLPLEVERNIYHIALELINNTIKHAEAESITLQISQAEEEINVFYEDDGKGFDVQNVVDSGMGMRSIYARVNTISGAVYFNSKPGKGINVVMTIPVKEDHSEEQKSDEQNSLKSKMA